MHADIRQRTASSRPEQENLTTGAVKSRTTALLRISYIDSPITDLPPNATHGGIIYDIIIYYGRRFIVEISGPRRRRKHVIRGRCAQRAFRHIGIYT